MIDYYYICNPLNITFFCVIYTLINPYTDIPMKRFKLSFLLPILTVIFFSCTTSKDPVVGTWECFKIKPYQEPLQTTRTQPKVMDDASLQFDEKGTVPSSDAVFQQLFATYPDINKFIKIKGNKTVSLISKNKNLSGTWEMDQKANTIDIKLKKTDKVIRLQFTDPNQERLSVHEKFNYGEFDAYYQKAK